MLFKRRKKKNISISEALKLETWTSKYIADDVSELWDLKDILSTSKEFEDIAITDEMVNYVYLAALMPYHRMVDHVNWYDLHPHTDEIQFLSMLKNEFGVESKYEVIKRIRYVRGLKRWYDKNGRT